MIEENQGLVEEMKTLRATYAKEDERSVQLRKEYHDLEKSDIQFQTEMKHNVALIHKCNEAINDIQVKRTQLLEENTANERMLPQKENELRELIAHKAQVEAEFEKEEQKARELTERLRKQKTQLEETLNPLSNQFNRTKQSIDLRRQEINQIEERSQRMITQIEEFKRKINDN